MKPLLKKIEIELKTIIDPEIPVNILDFGLIYDVKITIVENKKVADVLMTLTSPTCPKANYIKKQIESKILKIDGIDGVRVKTTYQPSWNNSMITKEGKKILEDAGYAFS